VNALRRLDKCHGNAELAAQRMTGSVSARRPEPYRVRPLGGTRHRPYVVTWKDSSSGCSGETVGQGLL
jgi:hypothetical protein